MPFNRFYVRQSIISLRSYSINCRARLLALVVGQARRVLTAIPLCQGEVREITTETESIPCQRRLWMRVTRLSGRHKVRQAISDWIH